MQKYEQAKGRADGKIGLGSKKFPRLILQCVENFGISGAMKSAFCKTPLFGIHWFVFTSILMVPPLVRVPVKETERLRPLAGSNSSEST